MSLISPGLPEDDTVDGPPQRKNFVEFENDEDGHPLLPSSEDAKPILTVARKQAILRAYFNTSYGEIHIHIHGHNLRSLFMRML